MTHPVYGILSKEEFETLQKLPAGGFAKEIRKKDPLWGTTAGDGKDLRPYKIKVTATCMVTQTDSETFTVSACSEEQAKELAGELADRHRWHNLEEEPDDIEMEVIG